PEHPRRLMAVAGMLEGSGLAARCVRPQWTAANLQDVQRVHDADYVEYLKQYAAEGGGRIEVDTVLSERSYDVTMMAAGAATDAVGRVIRGEDRTALCLVRPPGHHARPQFPMGFCLLNNVAIAARAAIAEHSLDRVLIVDWDVHHGNGTQE